MSIISKVQYFLVRARRLAGVMGLDRLCEDLVSALAAAASVQAPAPPGSAAEGKQVAALAALVGLGTCPEAGLLGGGWVVILRCLSALEALQVGFRGLGIRVSPALPHVADEVCGHKFCGWSGQSCLLSRGGATLDSLGVAAQVMITICI